MRNKIAAENLRQVKLVLDGLGIPFCLFLGTALGAWRDHDFCPGDVDDIDIAVHVDHYKRAEAITLLLKHMGYEAHEYRDPAALVPELMYRKDYGDWKSKIDIFFIAPHPGEANKMVWTFYADPAQNKMIPNFFDTFDRVIFHNTMYNLPHPIEEYLVANYGEDWKTPIHRDDWDWKRSNKAPLL